MRCTSRFSIRPTLVLLVCVLASPAMAADGHPQIDQNKGWRTLFDGTNLDAWEIRKTDGRPGRAGSWVIEGDAITRKGGDYLWSKEKFGDFILDLEFKVAPGTNSGILLRHLPERPEGKSYWYNGLLEIQVLDSAGTEKPGKHDCGALYDMVAPKANAMKPAGEWNRMTITAKGSKIQAVMNGQQVLDVDLNDWPEANKNPDGTPNKYNKPMKDIVGPGYIMFQEHGGPVWFRNVSIKPLD